MGVYGHVEVHCRGSLWMANGCVVVSAPVYGATNRRGLAAPRAAGAAMRRYAADGRARRPSCLAIMMMTAAAVLLLNRQLARATPFSLLALPLPLARTLLPAHAPASEHNRRPVGCHPWYRELPPPPFQSSRGWTGSHAGGGGEGGGMGLAGNGNATYTVAAAWPAGGHTRSGQQLWRAWRGSAGPSQWEAAIAHLHQ